MCGRSPLLCLRGSSASFERWWARCTARCDVSGRLIDTCPPKTFDKAMAANCWNLLDQSGYDLLRRCEKEEIDVTVVCAHSGPLLLPRACERHSLRWHRPTMPERKAIGGLALSETSFCVSTCVHLWWPTWAFLHGQVALSLLPPPPPRSAAVLHPQSCASLLSPS